MHSISNISLIYSIHLGYSRQVGDFATHHRQPRDLHNLLLVLPFVRDQQGQDLPLGRHLELLPRRGLQGSSVQGDEVTCGVFEGERLDADRLPEPTELGFGTWRCQSNPGSNFVRDNSMTDMELTSSRVRVI